ncbi:MAG: RagB/SusD family nutrient uptake outer membrane protein [Bacteroidales bacterium]|nr:RagB/SusD family nutrient uptake outer membrane protein [Bacteroidales bacterium]
MKKIFTYFTAIILSFGLVSCDKIFDSLEGDLSKMYEDDLTSSEAGLVRLLASAYGYIPMENFSTFDKNTIDATDAHGAGYSIQRNGGWSYSNIRTVNKLFNQIQSSFDKGVIPAEVRDAMLGEAHFVRGYIYFGMVRTYGGVPIVTEPLDDKYDGGEDVSGLLVPRSTEKETWDFVINEFEEAAKLLPASRTDGEYRVTKYAAYALEARAALFAASVSKYWNNAPIANTFKAVQEKLTYMEASYANAYYQKAIDAAKQVIDSGMYSLYGGTAPASVDAAKKSLQDLFTARRGEEFIFGRSYELGQTTSSNGFDYGNSPNQVHAAGGTGWQWGRYCVTLDLVDAFDNYVDAKSNRSRAEGVVATRNDGKEDEYVTNLSLTTQTGFSVDTDYIKYDDPAEAFANKDARFQAHVVYPGSTFRGEKIIIQGGIIDDKGEATFYTQREVKVGDKSYYTFGAENDANFSGFYEMTNTNAGNWYNTGFGIAKFLDPSQAQLYSTNPWPDVRYAEVLLTYAEAVAESGQGDKALAKQCLNDIRHRAAYTDDVELTVENVLHERRVELAFENDLSYTMLRRREFAFGAANGLRKHALVPTLDLRGGDPKYILVRANVYHGDVYASTNGLYISDYRSYYNGVSNWQKNEITPNPSQE